jgi:hypothetical protein
MTICQIRTLAKGASTEITREKFSLDQNGITQWLSSKGILSNEILFSYSDVLQWTRTGGETYAASFEITTEKQRKLILIKAIVTITPERSLLDWERRREVLRINGISVSHWYHHSAATIIEDFYPNTFEKVEFEKLLAIGYKLDQLGFTTLSFLADIRADQNGNPFYVDFGFDLGEPSANGKTCAKEYFLRQYPERQNDINLFYEQNKGK